MRISITLTIALLVITGCSNQPSVDAIGRFGGYTTPTYDGYLADMAPVARVDFSTKRSILTDDDLAQMLPALKKLNPRSISLGGQHLTDKSIDLLNQLDFMTSVNLEGTYVTPQGLARLKLARWE